MNIQSGYPSQVDMARELSYERQGQTQELLPIQSVLNPSNDQINNRNNQIDLRNEQINEVFQNPQGLQLIQMDNSIHMRSSQVSNSSATGQTWYSGTTSYIPRQDDDSVFSYVDSKSTISSIYMEIEVSIEEIYAPMDASTGIDMCIRYLGNRHSYTYDWLCIPITLAYRIRSISPIICSEQFDDILNNFEFISQKELDKNIDNLYKDFSENVHNCTLPQLLLQAGLYNHMFWLFEMRWPQLKGFNQRRKSKKYMDQLMLSLYWRQENDRRYEQNPLYPLVQ